MNKRYIISLDLDNTLLNTKGKISNKTKKYLKELHDNGNIIVIATGRIFDTCYEVISKLDFINYMVTDTGGLIYDVKNNKIIYKRKFSKENIKSLINLYDESLEYVEFSDEHFYHKYSNKEINHYGLSRSIENINEFIKNNTIIHSTIKLVNQNDNYKMIERINNEYKNLSAFEMRSESGNTKWIEIVRKNVTKFSAIKYISKIEKISILNTISFGDNYNDIEMLENSKYGVAMGNAPDEIKNRVLYTTKTCDEDGVEFFLRGFFKEWLNIKEKR